MQLVRGDISNGNGLSKITMAALGDAFKERGRDDSTGVGKIRKQVKAINGATEELNDSLKSSSDRFGSLQNEFESYNLKQLEKLKADLDYQIKDAKAVGGLKEIFIGLNDGTIKGFDNLADFETTRRKILDALDKKREEEKTKHDSNFGVQKRAAKKEWDEAKAELKKSKPTKINIRVSNTIKPNSGNRPQRRPTKISVATLPAKAPKLPPKPNQPKQKPSARPISARMITSNSNATASRLQ